MRRPSARMRRNIVDVLLCRDIQFSGFVTYTGSSSMEVFVRMEGLGTRPGDEPKTIMLGKSKA